MSGPSADPSGDSPESAPGSGARRQWWLRRFREAFGKPFWVFTAFAAVMAGLVFWLHGPDSLVATMDRNLGHILTMVPRIIFAIMLAGFLGAVLPRERLSRVLGKHSGLLGMVIASAAGTITPGGPASAFPILAILGAAGADRGIMIAYITAWATLGIQRIVMWDMSLMGPDFTVLRVLVSLPVPILAGLIARRIPIEIELKEEFLRSAGVTPARKDRAGESES